jgi:hypothetical protein
MGFMLPGNVGLRVAKCSHCSNWARLAFQSGTTENEGNMRDRSLTPFFPLHLLGLEPPADSPGISARSLEGHVVGNGRFLLMEKTDHTEDSARFVAKDMVGGIDVELEVHRCDERGFRVGASTTTPKSRELDLWTRDVEETGEIVIPKPANRVRRALKRITGLLRIAS